MRSSSIPPWIRRAALAAGLLALAPSTAYAGDTVSVSTNDGYGRILLTLTPPAHAQASTIGGVFTIAFDRKVAVDPSSIAQTLAPYISNAHIDSDGKTFRFALTQTVRLHTSTMGDKIAIDLMPATFAGTPPDLPAPPPPPPKAVDISTLEGLKVRTGSYPNFTRIVFDWPRNVPYTVFPGAGKLIVRFEAEARPDLSAIDKFQPPWVKNAGWHVENKGTVVEFETDADAGYHDFRDGTHVVIDVLAPKTDATAYSPPGTAKPTPTTLAANAPAAPSSPPAAASAKVAAAAPAKATSPAPAPAKTAVTTTVTTQQAQEIAAAAVKLNPQPAATAPVAAATTPAPTAATGQAAAPTPASDLTGPMQSATALATHNGITLTFAGAGTRPAAVFMRGLTAWIVIETPAGIDAVKLKAALGTLPAYVDASSGNGIITLRIGFNMPEQIAARDAGGDLKVAIAPQLNDVPTAIGFVRNQDDPRLASLSTLLPGADRSVAILDPVAGDALIIVPAAPGRAVIAPHAFVEFSLLQTASGLVVTPFVDDLDVQATNARVSITHQGGLSLTPPELPAPNSPSALARGGNGPCFLDFANWSKTDGKNFLDSERKLRQVAAHTSPQDATYARIALARFYLSNGFAAEALGLIDLLQASEPSLQADRQLQTMRAAADYMMGRYRDAHNDIAAAAFDGDRHAAFWRGLIEAALENWDGALAAFAESDSVMKLYPPEWQARARIAEAQTGLGKGTLEMVDAALTHLPAEMPKPETLNAELVRARLYAAESRYPVAAPLFDEVEKTGDERQAAQAIYYRTDAALISGAISPATAAEKLEQLRFRWRGDSLEMKSLRRLAAIYFAAQDWRRGLLTLRVATRNFPNDDLARQAQDDMRTAFANLFLKGQADKMPPVEALALFYDFIDLTPIGPDGDEMIRRMADRLAAVDLLEPAEDLLNYQVTKRLDGVARAQVATRLAMIDLMDKKPKQALATLRDTQLSTLPDDVNHQRLLLEARALGALKQWDLALDLISVDQAPDTARLRADLYWESGNWAIAGQKAEDLLAMRWSDPTPLTVDERDEVMRAAIAYSLANDQASLDRLRAHFTDKMKTTPDASSFAVVTQRIDLHGVAFRDTAGQIASIDTLDTFMKDFRRRYDSGSVTN